MKTRQIFFIAALFFCLNVEADLYKYIDDNGRVNYTDRKPVQEDAIKLGALPSPEKKTRISYNPIERPLHQQFHRILVLFPELAWADDDSKRKQIGVFRFGKTCGSPTSMLWPEVTYSHRSMLASPGDMAGAVGKKLGLLGYKYATQYSSNLQRQLERFQGYILKATVTSLEVEACAAGTTRTYRDQSLERFPVSSFRKNRAEVTVKWQLYKDIQAEPLFTRETKGYSDSFRQPAYMQAVMEDAVVNALEGFLSEQQIIDQLLVTEEVVPVARKPVPMTEKEDSLTDRLLRKLEGFWQGSGLDPLKGANVLTELQRVKVMVFTDLAEHGEVSDQLLEALARQRWSDPVSSVDVGFDGSISLHIEGEPGEDRYLRYYPVDDSLDFSGWVCETNLPESWFPTGLNCPLVK